MSGSLSTTTWLTGTTVGVVALITLGLSRASRRARLPRNVALSVAAGLSFSLDAMAALAQSGLLRA